MTLCEIADVRRRNCTGNLVRGLAACPAHDDVVRGVLVELRCTVAGRLLGIDHRRQHRVVDLDQVKRVDRDLSGLGYNARDWVADEVDLVDRQERAAC